MATRLTPLGELVVGLAPTDPDTGASLLSAEVEDLSPAARELRRHLVDALNASERPALLHPQEVYDILRKRHLAPIKGRWNAYALDRTKRTVRVAHPSGGTRNVLVVSAKFPTPDDLPVLPEEGSWLIVWHGGVEVLEIPGVAHRIAHLRASSRVTDVVFWDTPDATPLMFSLVAGKGVRAGKAVSFPAPDAVRDATPNPKECS
jgi:hypothetical protein